MSNVNKGRELVLPLVQELKNLSKSSKISLLTHYTSVSAFEQFISNKEIWFSNPLRMSDISEVRGFMEAAVARVTENIQGDVKLSISHKNLLVDEFSRHLQDFEQERLFKDFVFCLSEHRSSDTDGLLSLWRGYGNDGGGVAVVFNRGKIQEMVKGMKFFHIYKISYKSDRLRSSWLDVRLRKILQGLTSGKPSDQDVRSVAYWLSTTLITWAIFSKHRGFREEREWRLAHLGHFDPRDKLPNEFDYHCNSHGIDPKLKLSIPWSSKKGEASRLNWIIETVILGPSLSDRLSRDAVESMLTKYKEEALISKLHTSSIPYRPYRR